MTIENPYQPPKSFTLADNSQDCRREGKYVFVPVGQDLPPRCVICNAEVTAPIKQKTMYWHSQWLYLLILLNVVFYAIVAVLVRKKTKVSPGYCTVHLAARRRKINGLIASILLPIIGGIILIANDQDIGFFGILIGILMIIPFAVILGRFRPVRIDKTGAKFAGCKEPFLDSLM